MKHLVSLIFFCPGLCFAAGKVCGEVHINQGLQSISDGSRPLGSIEILRPDPDELDADLNPISMWRVPQRAPSKFPVPFVLMDLESPLHSQGRFKLIELVSNRYAIHARQTYTLNLISQLQHQYPQAEFDQRKDLLLTFTIVGERAGMLRRLALNTINRASLDLVGVDAYVVEYKADPERPLRGQGTGRLVIVIKDGAKDYRGIEGEPMTEKKEFSRWVSEQLSDTFVELLNTRTFLFDRQSPLFQKAYRAMLAAAGRRTPLTEDQFLFVYRKAYYQFMDGISGPELLHLRPSFWEDVPVADAFAERTHKLLNQSDSAEAFNRDFAKVALTLRHRLFEMLFQTVGRGRSSYYDSDFRDHTPASLTGKGDTNYILSGAGAQLRDGSDFYQGHDNQNQSLARLQAHGNEVVDSAIQKLADHGITEIVQLTGTNAQQVMNFSNLTMTELTGLARELAVHGVYFRYPRPLLLRLSIDERTELRPPSGREFQYSAQSNSYHLIDRFKSKSGTEKDRQEKKVH